MPIKRSKRLAAALKPFTMVRLKQFRRDNRLHSLDESVRVLLGYIYDKHKE